MLEGFWITFLVLFPLIIQEVYFSAFFSVYCLFIITVCCDKRVYCEKMGHSML